MMIRTLRGERMSDDGMHKNVGGREKRPLTQMQSDKSEIICLLYTSPSPRDRG